MTTLEVSTCVSSKILALITTNSSSLIRASRRPCSSFAAEYSAFSDKSPLSLASAIAFATDCRPVVFIPSKSAFNLS